MSEHKIKILRKYDPNENIDPAVTNMNLIAMYEQGYLSLYEFINAFPDSISESQEYLFGSKCVEFYVVAALGNTDCRYYVQAMEAINMKRMKGVVSKIRVLKMSKTPLVRFSNEVNCLTAAHSLNFLADVDEGMQIVVAGEYNERKQFVVKKYSVIGKRKL